MVCIVFLLGYARNDSNSMKLDRQNYLFILYFFPCFLRALIINALFYFSIFCGMLSTGVAFA